MQGWSEIAESAYAYGVAAKEAEMLKRGFAVIAVSLLVSFGFAKDKKPPLPAYVLSSKTVAVIIDPSAGISVEDPRANEEAQKDVEAALLSWGRLEPVQSRETADLIIVVRKGNGRMTNETLPNAGQNNRIGMGAPGSNGGSVGGPRGMPDQSGMGAGQQSPGPQMEIGHADDLFVVYKGGDEKPLDAAPAWRYVGTDGLSPRLVPAMAAFRKAVENAEKAAAAKKP